MSRTARPWPAATIIAAVLMLLSALWIPISGAVVTPLITAALTRGDADPERFLMIGPLGAIVSASPLLLSVAFAVVASCILAERAPGRASAAGAVIVALIVLASTLVPPLLSGVLLMVLEGTGASSSVGAAFFVGMIAHVGLVGIGSIGLIITSVLAGRGVPGSAPGRAEAAPRGGHRAPALAVTILAALVLLAWLWEVLLSVPALWGALTSAAGPGSLAPFQLATVLRGGPLAIVTALLIVSLALLLPRVGPEGRRAARTAVVLVAAMRVAGVLVSYVMSIVMVLAFPQAADASGFVAVLAAAVPAGAAAVGVIIAVQIAVRRSGSAGPRR
ncbi:hypothetical protein [Brachybacterium hainanense]|uniref:Uncharacterized protein n=1 Tax=Brachybacterium hainanense TaxID=1541174 RepID=A0ABV6RF64_9MICO